MSANIHDDFVAIKRILSGNTTKDQLKVVTYWAASYSKVRELDRYFFHIEKTNT